MANHSATCPRPAPIAQVSDDDGYALTNTGGGNVVSGLVTLTCLPRPSHLQLTEAKEQVAQLPAILTGLYPNGA